MMKSYTVIFRTGGTENFRWNKALPVATIEEARTQRDAIERGGRPALIHDTARLNLLGLPETYAIGDSLDLRRGGA